MVFSSITFLLYFLPFFLLGYNLIRKEYKNIYILIASIFFYSWGAPKFIYILLFTTTIDFYLVKIIDNAKTLKTRRLFLVLSLLMNIGLLAYFKYSNFFIENVNAVLTSVGITNIGWVKIVLPIGISFYTFETVTYVVDVYRRVHKPLNNFWDYQLYIILFPKLIAGPIVRFHSIADQINERNETLDDKIQGFYRFCIGLGKKILIANVIGEQADTIMNQPPEQISTLMSWVGIISYTFQIYFDFSGYSDMALGLSRMMGFYLPENFNNPYNSTSITEFWRRWHISLGQWMKNYLYIPLGGNQTKTKYRLFFNLWLVFLISGLWHGASWNFVVWGAFHGLFLILDRLFLLRFYEYIGSFFSTIITFFIVLIGWVFFRIVNLEDSFIYIEKMFTFNGVQEIELTGEFITVLCVAILFSFIGSFSWGKMVEKEIFYKEKPSLRWYLLMMLISFVLFILSVSSLTADGFNPFIYFRF